MMATAKTILTAMVLPSRTPFTLGSPRGLSMLRFVLPRLRKTQLLQTGAFVLAPQFTTRSVCKIRFMYPVSLSMSWSVGSSSSSNETANCPAFRKADVTDLHPANVSRCTMSHWAGKCGHNITKATLSNRRWYLKWGACGRRNIWKQTVLQLCIHEERFACIPTGTQFEVQLSTL